jgi:hypothetical protein
MTRKTINDGHHLQQADTTLDIYNIGRSLKAVSGAHLVLEAEVAKVGMSINEQKTKFKIAARY